MTFINLDARLPPTATLCMPGFPPRHVCVAERRVLLTYLLTGFVHIEIRAQVPASVFLAVSCPSLLTYMLMHQKSVLKRPTTLIFGAGDC